MWEYVGMSRNKEGLTKAIDLLKEAKEEFWTDLKVPGTNEEMNMELEKAIRLADFFEIGELMAHDAIHREESCGGHFREEHQTEDGETKRNDKDFMYVSVWGYKGEGNKPVMHKEQLNYEFVDVEQRSYK